MLRYFTVYGPRQRPDMFLARVVAALAEGGSFELYGDGEQSRSFTYVADAVAATIAAMERAPAGALYNVGGGDEATMLEAIALLERISGRTLDVAHSRAVAGRPRADEGRHDPDPRRARLGAARRRSRTACGPSGSGLPARVAAR